MNQYRYTYLIIINGNRLSQAIKEHMLKIKLSRIQSKRILSEDQLQLMSKINRKATRIIL